MTLRDTLESSFSGDGFDAGAALEELAGLYAALDLPASPLDPASIARQIEALGEIDPDRAAGLVEAPFRAAATALDALPGLADLTGPLASSLPTLEALGRGSAGLLDGLRGSLVTASPDEPGGERIARAMTGLSALGDTPLPALLRAAAPDAIPGGAGAGLHDVLAGGGALPSLLATLRGLMELAAGIDRAVALREAVASLPDPASLAALRAELATWDPTTTVARIASGDPVNDIVADVAPALARIRNLEQALADLVAGTAAIVATLDLAGVQATWRQVDQSLRSLDPAPIRALAEALVARLDGLLRVRPGDTAATADAFAAEIAALLQGLADAIAGIEVERFGRGIEAGARRVTAPLRETAEALTSVRGAVVDAEQAVADALGAVDLDAVAAGIRTVTEPVTAALEEIRTVLGGVSAELGTAAAGATRAIEELRTQTEAAAGAMTTAFTAVAGALDQLDLAGRLEQVRTALEPVAAALDDVHIGEAADAASDGIERVASVIDALPLDLLPDSARSELDTAIRPLKAFDFDTEVRARVAAQLDEIQAAIDQDVLAQVRAALAEAAAFIASIDPHPPLEAFERETFEPALARVHDIDPDAALAPLREALDAVPDLSGLLDPADRLFDELLARYDAFAPRSLLEPITAPLDAARAEVAAQLRLDAVRAQLDAARDGALAAIDEVSVGPWLDALAQVADATLPGPGAGRGGAIGQVVVRLTGGAELLDPRSFAAASDWIAGRAEVTAASDALGGTRDALLTLRDTVRGLDPGAILAELQPGYDAVAAAIADLPARTPLRRRLAALLPPSPAALAAPLAQGRGDVLPSVTGALTLASQLAGFDMRPIATAVRGLAEALAPLLVLRDWLSGWIRRTGVTVDEGDLATAARTALVAVRDQVRTAAGARLEAQLRGTLRDAMTATVDALLAAVDEARASLDALDLEPVIAELEGLHAAKRAELAQLRPSTQLADVAAALRTLEHDVRTFDPLADVRPVLAAFRAAADSVGTELRPSVLLAPALEAFQRTADALAAADIDRLFGPVLDALERVTGEVDDGLGDVGTAFGRLQAALP